MSSEWYINLMGEVTGPITQDKLITAVVEGKVDKETSVRQGIDGNWNVAINVKGLFEKAEKLIAKQEHLILQQEANTRCAQERERLRWSNIVISTGSPPNKNDFAILDTVFAIDSDADKGLFFSKSADPSDAFERVKQRLKEHAYALGADGVFNCLFEYRDAVGDSGLGEHHVVEIFAYGTAVRYV